MLILKDDFYYWISHRGKKKGFSKIGWGRMRNEKAERSRRWANSWEKVRDKDSRMTWFGYCERRGADCGFPYFKSSPGFKCPEVSYCKRVGQSLFFPDKIGGCSSDYLPSVVYSSSIAEEPSRRGEKELLLIWRLNVHSEVDSAEPVPS